jgi:hypothetical protein
MFTLFTNKVDSKEANLRAEIQRRAEVNTVARTMAVKIAKEKIADKAIAESKTALNKETMLKTLDTILDSVSGYDNIKISTLAELYNAIESGDAKDLIKFLKAKEKTVKKAKKKKSSWEK